MIRSLFTLLLLASTLRAEPPNVVVILADDLGWGDVSSYNPESKIQTPAIDSLAATGIKFGDGHSNSSVCTPTRYGILTGRYAWRSRLKRGVLNGSSPTLIEPDRPTIASVLKEGGYHTACLGKWHLGLDWQKDGKKVDFTQPIQRGVNEAGFDYFLGIAASLDMPPYALIENNTITQDLDQKHSGTRGLDFTRPGAKSSEFEFIDYLPGLAKSATAYISERAKSDQPFFLYLPLPSPHKPVIPAKEFQGKSGIGPYGDYVVETDWAVAQVIDALKASGELDNTLIIFTSDNASFAIPESYGVVQQGHQPNAHFRGQKTDAYEGGHRVPFIVSWPAQLKPGTSDEVICTTDIMATALAAADLKMPSGAGEDSYDFLPHLKGAKSKPVREATIHHSINGTFAIRKGPWKFIEGKGSGGRTKVPADSPKIQLYHLIDDPSEAREIHAQHSEIVKELQALLERYRQQPSSLPKRSPSSP